MKEGKIHTEGCNKRKTTQSFSILTKAEDKDRDPKHNPRK